MQMVTVLLLGSALGQYQPTYQPQQAPYAQQEALGVLETVYIPSQGAYCRCQKVLSGPNTGLYRIWERLAGTPVAQPTATEVVAAELTATQVIPTAKTDVVKEETAKPDPKAEKLGPVETVNLEGYGQCEAQKILANSPEVGKYRIVRQLTPPAPAGDPYGFIGWLNSTRAAYGLGPVGYDQNLSNWAAQNNNAQLARGMGHFIMGPARRQNAAWGAADAASVGAMWMGSGGHRAALLDPTISWIGIAAAGAYWTFNAY